MKVAVLSESPADEAAIRILVEGILGRQTQSPALSSFRTRAPGISGVFRAFPAVLKELYYNQQDAEGLIVVVDSDHTPVHSPEHEQPGSANETGTGPINTRTTLSGRLWLTRPRGAKLVGYTTSFQSVKN